MCKNCIQFINRVAPVKYWPRYHQKLILESKHINRSKRIECICFLVGNGIISYDMICCLLNKKLRDRSAHIHLQTTFNDAMKKSYDHTWKFYSVQEECYLFLNGNICPEHMQFSKSKFKIASWNKYASRKHTTLREQQLYFGEDNETCVKVHDYLQKLDFHVSEGTTFDIY